MNEYIKSDLYRYYGKTGFLTFMKGYIINRCFRYQVSLRLCNDKGLKKLLGYFLYLISRIKYTIRISPKTKIGYGLYIGHFMPLIVGPNTIIGNNCNISQFVNIGSNEGKKAVIGDNVYIGPHVCIVDEVNIGDNATIGAGSVVTKDIPENATAVGNYAKVINYNNPGRYILNKWKIKKKK